MADPDEDPDRPPSGATDDGEEGESGTVDTDDGPGAGAGGSPGDESGASVDGAGRDDSDRERQAGNDPAGNGNESADDTGDGGSSTDEAGPPDDTGSRDAPPDSADHPGADEFGGGAAPGADPHDAGPGAGSEDYEPDREDERAGRDRTWTDEDSVRSELDRLWAELEGLEDHVEGRTISRAAFEADMRRYVRWRLRKGHVTGWGPYVVLLYGTGMTLGAFYYLEAVWAVLAMVVVWLSTLGLYVVMVMLGIGIGGVRFAWKYLDRIRTRGSES